MADVFRVQQPDVHGMQRDDIKSAVQNYIKSYKPFSTVTHKMNNKSQYKAQ